MSDWSRLYLNRLIAVAAFAFCFFIAVFARADTTLFNVSYDPTREVCKAINEQFVTEWKRSGQARQFPLKPPPATRAEVALESGAHLVDVDVSTDTVLKPGDRIGLKIERFRVFVADGPVWTGRRAARPVVAG